MRALIMTHHEVPLLERWCRDKERTRNADIRICSEKQLSTQGRGAWDVVVVVGGSLSLTRENVSESCARFGWNPLRVFTFPLDESLIPRGDTWLPRWEIFFQGVLAAKNGVPDVKAHRLTPSSKVKVISHPDTERKEVEDIITGMRQKKLDVSLADGDWRIIREGVNYRFITSDREEIVGAIVIVPQVEERFFLHVPDQIIDTRRLVTLHEFSDKMKRYNFRRQRIAFLVPSPTTPPRQWEQVFSLSEKLCKRDCAQVMVLCAETVVAGEGLEESYRRSRQAGTLYEKTDLTRAVFQETIDMRGIQVSFRTERDGVEQTLLFDWLISVPEQVIQPFDISNRFESDKILTPFSRPANSNLPPYSIHCQGMFLISPFSTLAERDELASGLQKYLADCVIAEEGRVEVDEEKCILCLTCMRTCPWGAVDVEGKLKRRKARVNWQICRLCGLCASSCPAEAITIAGFPAGNGDTVSVISCGGEVS